MGPGDQASGMPPPMGQGDPRLAKPDTGSGNPDELLERHLLGELERARAAAEYHAVELERAQRVARAAEAGLAHLHDQAAVDPAERMGIPRGQERAGLTG